MIDVCKELLKDPKVYPVDMNNFAIRSASDNGHFEICDLLLNDPIVQPHSEDNEAFRNACSRGHEKIVKLILKDGRFDLQLSIIQVFALLQPMVTLKLFPFY